ncbi:hypothetical protein BTM25_52840 [Actinomadura rubteroloni]|uniref:Uncharacterized protein n=1 Tax=Actinomadura rubteroloni TaxID=1926885 RepID=A0A2P4UDF3_9ACTN|nr:hypothetical protein [Actinomadura rubteroloni]POM23078.1 hypothetical protein BTM25_52840 [Actinomadura rubteroloni]
MSEKTPDAAELELLPTSELHDRAVARARERRDLGFLWELLRAIPAAAAATGEVDRAEFDMLHVMSLLEEFRYAGDSDLADALRPVYVSYLTEHGG